MDPTTFLLVSSDIQTRRVLERVVPRHAVILTADTPLLGIRQIQQSDPACVLCEGAPHTVIPLIQEARLHQPSLPVIVIGPQASIHDAVETMRAGAADYLTKPLDPEELEAAIRRILLTGEPAQTTLKPVDRFDLIVSVSPQM